MGLLLLIPGLILWLVDASWFAGQDTVGLILTVVGAALILGQIVMTLIGVAWFNRERKSMNRSFFGERF